MFKFFKNLLKKIEEQNKESFGNSKLDCCDLNKKDSQAAKSESKVLVFRNDSNK